jgi:hypothetical protein
MKVLTSRLSLIYQMPATLKIIALSLAIALTAFFIYCQFGVNLADEGFLWYGMIRTHLGEVPIRDFHAYDPGRYYWGALCFKLFKNSGPIAFRASLALFEFGGLTFLLLCLRRTTKSWSILLFAGLLIYSWMYIHYKVFDIAVAIAAVYFAILLLENSSLQRHLMAGVFVGASAFIGINHGLYTSLSFALLIIFIWLKFSQKLLFKRFLFWGFGILIGYSPMLLMYAVVPNFFSAYLSWINAILHHGTNMPLPVSWPWSIDYAELSPIQGLIAFSGCIYFLIFPVFTLLSIFYLIFSSPERLKRQHSLIAATVVGLTYIHYVFDRPDSVHLTFGIVPLLIGLLSLPSSFKFNATATQTVFKVVLLAFIFLTTFLSIGTFTPWYQAHIIAQATMGLISDYVPETIQGNTLWWSQEDAALIKTVKQINSQLIGGDEDIFLAPSWPGLYAAIEKKSPTRDIYFLFRETPEKQNKIIDQIKRANINWAIIRPNDAIDGRDELRFRNAYSLVWKYFSENFEVVRNTKLPEGALLMRKKKALDS